MSAYDKTSVQIDRCKRILALVDDYVEKQTATTRTDLRKALMEEFEEPAIAPPVAAGSVDTEEFRNYLAWRCRDSSDEFAQRIIAHVDAWGAQQREAGWVAGRRDQYQVAIDQRDRAEKHENAALFATHERNEAIRRAEKAEAELKQVNAWREAALHESRQMGDMWAAKVEKAEAHAKALEAQLARRRAPLSPETQQAIEAARAAGQSIVATPGGLVFLNDGAEPDYSELDCPTCGGSGHKGDVAGSAP